MIQLSQPRLIGIGEPEKLWVPSEADLAREHWNNAYLYYADLSGRKLPPMVDADVIHYNGERTVFDDCTYTQFRFPLSLVGAVFGKFSTLNHDFLTEIVRRTPGQASSITAAYMGQNYGRCTENCYHNLKKELGMTLREAYEAALVMFDGYEHAQKRMTQAYETGHTFPGMVVPSTDLSKVDIEMQNGKQEFDLRNGLSGWDRWAAARMLEQRVGDPRIEFWFAQMNPPILCHRDYMVSPDVMVDLKRIGPE